MGEEKKMEELAVEAEPRLDFEKMSDEELKKAAERLREMRGRAVQQLRKRTSEGKVKKEAKPKGEVFEL